MPITAHLDTVLNLLCVICSGTVTDAEVYAAHAERERLLVSMKAIDELVDAGGITSIRGVTHHSLRAGSQREAGKNWAIGGRLVIVAPDLAIYGTARIYTVVAEGVRAAVKVTRTMDDAVTWLGYDGERLQRFLRRKRQFQAEHAHAIASARPL